MNLGFLKKIYKLKKRFKYDNIDIVFLFHNAWQQKHT